MIHIHIHVHDTRRWLVTRARAFRDYARAFRDFDPEEPRDESGQWTKGGTGREAGFAPVEKTETGFKLPGGGKLPAHIAKLRIPPAWTDVRYNPDPKGALLVSGTDAKGRRQPIYSERHAKSQAAAKFKRIQQLEPKFDRITKANATAMRSRDARKRDLAAVTALIMHTGIRPGSEQNTGAEKQAYGATTLQGQHVVTDGDTTTLNFVGKKGKDLSIPVTDPDIASDLKRRAKEAGASGQLFPQADARRLLGHVQSIAGKGFKTKDFRTLIGTKAAAACVKALGVPKTMAEYKKAVRTVATKVAETLGNTPAIALQSYISPNVFADWKLASETK